MFFPSFPNNVLTGSQETFSVKMNALIKVGKLGAMCLSERRPTLKV